MNTTESWSVLRVDSCPEKPQVEAQLSGSTAAAMLNKMWHMEFNSNPLHEAIARRTYTALAHVVDQIDVTDPNRPLPSVVLDGRADDYCCSEVLESIAGLDSPPKPSRND